MLASEFWCNLAREFRALPIVDGEFRADRILTVDDRVPPQSAIWTINCANRNIEQRWRTLAKRGGDSLSQNDFVDAISVWLETLRTEKINSAELPFLSGGPCDSQGVENPVVREVINDMAAASATLCDVLEERALDRERAKRAAKTPGVANQQTVHVPEARPEPPANLHESAENNRRTIVDPLLKAKGWSVLDWAITAKVTHATAMDYLNLKTRPYASTRLKLANALGIPEKELPG
jgi:hypothetical protein